MNKFYILFIKQFFLNESDELKQKGIPSMYEQYDVNIPIFNQVTGKCFTNIAIIEYSNITLAAIVQLNTEGHNNILR